MLSAARPDLIGTKHLQYLLENIQMQILRFAQDDMATGFFSNLIGRSSRSKAQRDRSGLSS